MDLQDVLDANSSDGRKARVYSPPYQTADGATVIVVSKVRGKIRPSGDEAIRARPVGVFVIRGEDVRWEPAVDATLIAFVGVLTGLVSATLATVAMVRRPPWPDLRGTIG